MIRTLALAAAAATIALSAAPADAMTPRDSHHDIARPSWTTTPCHDEDSVNCYWDAKARGNGQGHSYYAVEMPGSKHMVCVMYWHDRFAAHHNYCA